MFEEDMFDPSNTYILDVGEWTAVTTVELRNNGDDGICVEQLWINDQEYSEESFWIDGTCNSPIVCYDCNEYRLNNFDFTCGGGADETLTFEQTFYNANSERVWLNIPMNVYGLDIGVQVHNNAGEDFELKLYKDNSCLAGSTCTNDDHVEFTDSGMTIMLDNRGQTKFLDIDHVTSQLELRYKITDSPVRVTVGYSYTKIDPCDDPIPIDCGSCASNTCLGDLYAFCDGNSTLECMDIE
eukprot:UN31807